MLKTEKLRLCSKTVTSLRKAVETQSYATLKKKSKPGGSTLRNGWLLPSSSGYYSYRYTMRKIQEH